jgi:hypothetical protein
METKIDKSEITQTDIKRWGKLDKDTVHGILWMLDKRINLPDHAYTTMSDTGWLKHFRKELVEYLDFQDKCQENNDKFMRIALSNMLDAYENPEY